MQNKIKYCYNSCIPCRVVVQAMDFRATVYKVIHVFSQEYLQGQNKNVLIKSTLQKLF